MNYQKVSKAKGNRILTEESRVQGYKTFFMLNSIEHRILIGHKYENIKKFIIFQAQISLEFYFFLLLSAF